MQKFPEIKTSIKELSLVPLAEKHIPFLVKLLSLPDIQKTLFRIPTKISAEKQALGIEKMYEGKNSKEITYILTLSDFLKSTPIGYVKIKLIDWSVKSCYLSTAILPDEKYRGKGYAKAAYNAFFDYLFSIGIKKIYGRTYENNTPTIKLNLATGFRFIGRQKSFIIYPNGTALDALFFEKTANDLQNTGNLPYQQTLDKLTEAFTPISVARHEETLKNDLISKTLDQISHIDTSVLPADLKQYVSMVCNSLNDEKGDKMETEELNYDSQNGIELLKIKEILTNTLEPNMTFSDSANNKIRFDRYNATLYLPKTANLSHDQLYYTLVQILLKYWRTSNQRQSGIQLLSLGITEESHTEEIELTNLLCDQPDATSQSDIEITNEQLYAPLSRETRTALATQLLGRDFIFTLDKLITLLHELRREIYR